MIRSYPPRPCRAPRWPPRAGSRPTSSSREAMRASSRASVDAYDRGVRGLLGFSADIIDSFRAAVAADPDFVLARAALATALFLAEKMAEAKAEMQQAAAAAPALPSRERRHVEALALWVAGRSHEAIPLIQACLAEHPRDMVLMQRLYYIYFWQGRSAEMLDLTRSVLPALDADGFMLGYHAFALEENRRYEEALPLAERAIAMNPRDAWAVHTLAHVLYERGENLRGIEALPLHIDPCDHLGYFKNHLLWHLALMHLAEARYDRVGELFQRVFGDIAITVGSDLQDSVALAWRLDLYGRPDPGRWTQLDRLRERGKKSRTSTLPEVVVPLLEGLHAFARGAYSETVAKIAPLESRIVEVGGSHAQREVFHDTLLEAALRARHPEHARPLLERRLAKRPNPGRHWAEARA